MRGQVLALTLLLTACSDEPLPPDPGASPGELHNKLIEEFFRIHDGGDEVDSILEATRRVLPSAQVDADDVRDYAREARAIIEGRFAEDPQALAHELVRRGILPRADAPAFVAWLDDPASEAGFANRELAADVRAHSASLWASKAHTTDEEIVTDIVDMVGALVGFHLGGSLGSILGGTLTSLTFVMLTQEEETDDFWDTWLGPLPPKR